MDHPDPNRYWFEGDDLEVIFSLRVKCFLYCKPQKTTAGLYATRVPQQGHGLTQVVFIKISGLS